MMHPADTVLEKLLQGNKQFYSGKVAIQSFKDAKQIMANAQHPIAIVLSCSDSRVLPEQIFSQGFGDLFVIRVAGNIAKPSQIGSIEYAVKQYDIPLVIVLGHSDCGAIASTIEVCRNPEKVLPNHLKEIVDDIKPAVIDVYLRNQQACLEEISKKAIVENVFNTVELLANTSDFLHSRIKENKLKVVAAKFNMRTAQVELYDEL